MPLKASSQAAPPPRTDSEFTLIERYFESHITQRRDVLLGIGDDCALLQAPENTSLAATMDTLVAGVHFLADADPEGIGHKALAVNLSDLAAMGAQPAWASLALTLPAADERWLAAFCRGFFALAEDYQVALVGGDMTHGPLCISVQAQGFVPATLALRRTGAQFGDRILVTGTPGDAGLALAPRETRRNLTAEHIAYLQARLDKPLPRIQQGLDLRGLATAAIDISDGLAQDLGHILERSGVGATLYVDRLPLSPAMAACPEQATAIALTGGDDYELCFTVPPRHLGSVQSLAAAWDCACTEIGVIDASPGLRCLREDGTVYPLSPNGYDHFA
ncbi:MAG: thiamine-phosphate kinase [Gammaproteobacteria bacterium]|nr:thiamine-phosphate kinase [Gammaproteobacteria bacterium]MCP5424408.1 thiamine-phosphate kinase [Gammaproteobacteria bacterium]MCP5458402.1 thiamine-phosphate kinase [Gammaproteobacteria bacterium]